MLTVSLRSFTLLLSTFMTHLMFCDRLADVPLYELDFSEMVSVAKPASPYVFATLTQFSLSLLSDALPPKAFLGCALDFDAGARCPPPGRDGRLRRAAQARAPPAPAHARCRAGAVRRALRAAAGAGGVRALS